MVGLTALRRTAFAFEFKAVLGCRPLPNEIFDMMQFNFKQHARALGRAAVVLPWVTLVACGGGETVSSSSVLQGTVYSGGAAVAGAEVVVMNRLTNQEHSTTTKIDGGFALQLPNGHYDYGATDEARHDATIHGLLTLDGAEAKVDINLPPQDAADDVISGTIYTTAQTPAAGYRLVLSSNHDDANLHLSATTDDQGRFEFKGIDGQLLFDLDIFDPDGQEVEFIDLHKLDGALHTTITLGDAADNNVHRHDQSAADGGAAIRVAAAGANQAFNALSGVDDLRKEYPDGALYRHTRFAESEPDGQERIADCWRTEPGGGDRYCKTKLEGGKLAFEGGDLSVNYANIRNYSDTSRRISPSRRKASTMGTASFLRYAAATRL